MSIETKSQIDDAVDVQPAAKRQRVSGETPARHAVLNSAALLAEILARVGVADLLASKAYRLSKLWLDVFLNRRAVWQT